MKRFKKWLVKECFVKLIEREGSQKEFFVFPVYRVSENADAVIFTVFHSKIHFLDIKKYLP